jgi:hypothetical protein
VVTQKRRQGGQVVSPRVSSPLPEPGVPADEGAATAGQDAATEALNDAFARLRPQGSDAWNFLANFTQMGERFGPDTPGASELSKLLDASVTPASRRGVSARRRRAEPEDAPSEVHAAMAQVVEAFRFLASRVQTLEDRLARQDRPIEGAAWLIPARELGEWVPPLVDHLVAAAPAGEVLHADCGEGQLLGSLLASGMAARGVEPRGGVALRALEQGYAVSIAEVVDDLAARSPGSLGGLVLSGVVDRLPLHAILLLLSEAHRVLALGAPIVVVATEPERASAARHVVADEILAPRTLHALTWEVLLARANFAGAGPLAGGPAGDGRVAIAATVPV